MKRLMRPILLEFCRTHLILTACAALLTVLTLALCTLLGLFIFHRLLLWDAFADWANSASIV